MHHAGDNTMMALIMAMSDRPAAEVISFHRLYAERYDWLKKQFTDWVFIFSTVFLYYEDQDRMEADIRCSSLYVSSRLKQ